MWHSHKLAACMLSMWLVCQDGVLWTRLEVFQVSVLLSGSKREASVWVEPEEGGGAACLMPSLEGQHPVRFDMGPTQRVQACQGLAYHGFPALKDASRRRGMAESQNNRARKGGQAWKQWGKWRAKWLFSPMIGTRECKTS